MLIAADELILEMLIDYIPDYLLEYYSDAMNALLYEKIFDYDSFRKLYTFYTITTTFPETIFKSENLISIKGNALIPLLKRDDFDMEEIDTWKCVMK